MVENLFFNCVFMTEQTQHIILCFSNIARENNITFVMHENTQHVFS